MTTKKEKQTVSEALLEHLAEWGMSQSELARYLGIDVKTINRLAKGRARLQEREAVLFDDVFGTERGFWFQLEAEQRYAKMEMELKRRGKRLTKKALAEFRASQEFT